MKIIDFEIKGNMVKFLLGAQDLEEWWGDDWNDCPYEHNAGSVYKQYISGERILVFGWDDLVYEPCVGERNSRYSKEDMMKRKVPCVCVLREEHQSESDYYWLFSDILGNENVIKYYFGDEMDPLDGKYDIMIR